MRIALLLWQPKVWALTRENIPIDFLFALMEHKVAGEHTPCSPRLVLKVDTVTLRHVRISKQYRVRNHHSLE